MNALQGVFTLTVCFPRLKEGDNTVIFEYDGFADAYKEALTATRILSFGLKLTRRKPFLAPITELGYYNDTYNEVSIIVKKKQL